MCPLVFGSAADLRLEVDLSERRLNAFVDGEVIEAFTVAVGKDTYPTPAGDFRIGKVIWNPSWRPPDSKWARDAPVAIEIRS